MSFTPFGFSSYCPWRPENRLTSRNPLTFEPSGTHTTHNIYNDHTIYETTNETHYHSTKPYESLMRLEVIEGRLRALEEKMQTLVDKVDEIEKNQLND